jgi:hypothetical protein
MEEDETSVVKLVIEAGALSAKLTGYLSEKNDEEGYRLANEIDSRLSIIESMLVGDVDVNFRKEDVKPPNYIKRTP